MVIITVIITIYIIITVVCLMIVINVIALTIVIITNTSVVIYYSGLHPAIGSHPGGGGGLL